MQKSTLGSCAVAVLTTATVGLFALEVPPQAHAAARDAVRNIKPQRANQEEIGIDFAKEIHQPSMAGFLNGIDLKASPPPELVAPLAPVLWRGGPNLIGYTGKLGAKYELTMSNLWGVPRFDWSPHMGPPYCNRKPDDCSASERNWGDYEKLVEDTVAAHKTEVAYWEFWNEPELASRWPQSRSNPVPCPTPWGQDTARDLLFQTYMHFYQAVRKAAGADALVVAPSISTYCPEYIGAFLDFAADKHLEVNVLSWHELRKSEEDLPSVEQHLKDARARFFTGRYAALNLKSIHINEVGGPKHTFNPGEAASYLYFLERGGADMAGHACWPDGNSTGCQNGSIDSLVTPSIGESQRPRATWWVYKSYADIRKHRVACNVQTRRASCLAGLNENGEPVLIIGSFGDRGAGSNGIVLKLRNVTRLPSGAADVLIYGRVAHLKPGPGPVVAPDTSLSSNFSAREGLLDITLPALGAHEAYVVTLTAAAQVKPPPLPCPQREPLCRQ